MDLESKTCALLVFKCLDSESQIPSLDTSELYKCTEEDQECRDVQSWCISVEKYKYESPVVKR